MPIKVELCAECAAKLRTIVAERGEEEMGRAAVPILAKCATCREQLPRLKLGNAVSRLPSASRLKRPS